MPYSWKVDIDLKLVVCFSTAKVNSISIYIWNYIEQLRTYHQILIHQLFHKVISVYTTNYSDHQHSQLYGITYAARHKIMDNHWSFFGHKY